MFRKVFKDIFSLKVMLQRESALQISPKAVLFLCPFCWTRYNKDGSPSKTAKRVVHCHGNDGTMHNKVMRRASQCDVRRFKGQFEIVVDDSTTRVH